MRWAAGDRGPRGARAAARARRGDGAVAPLRRAVRVGGDARASRARRARGHARFARREALQALRGAHRASASGGSRPLRRAGQRSTARRRVVVSKLAGAENLRLELEAMLAERAFLTDRIADAAADARKTPSGEPRASSRRRRSCRLLFRISSRTSLAAAAAAARRRRDRASHGRDGAAAYLLRRHRSGCSVEASPVGAAAATISPRREPRGRLPEARGRASGKPSAATTRSPEARDAGTRVAMASQTLAHARRTHAERERRINKSEEVSTSPPSSPRFHFPTGARHRRGADAHGRREPRRRRRDAREGRSRRVVTTSRSPPRRGRRASACNRALARRPAELALELVSAGFENFRRPPCARRQWTTKESRNRLLERARPARERADVASR